MLFSCLKSVISRKTLAQYGFQGVILGRLKLALACARFLASGFYECHLNPYEKGLAWQKCQYFFLNFGWCSSFPVMNHPYPTIENLMLFQHIKHYIILQMMRQKHQFWWFFLF